MTPNEFRDRYNYTFVKDIPGHALKGLLNKPEKQAASGRSMWDLTEAHERLLTIAGVGYDPETGEAFEEEELGRAFDALDDEAEAKILAAGFVSKRLAADAEALDAEIKRLTRMRDTARSGRELLIDRLREFMGTTGLVKVKSTYLSVSLGAASQRVEITDEKALRSDYLRTVTSVTPRKEDIARALKAGATVEGAKLVDGPKRVTIK